MPAVAHPDPLPRWVLDNPLRAAEIGIYETLKRQLPSRYRLYYSSPWLGTEPDGSEREGEADFVVASAETGFLVIEVKGGAIGRDRGTGAWHSVDRWGSRHAIKNPVAQASGGKHELLRRLREMPTMRNRFISAGIAVIFPHSTGGELLDGLDTPREKFALREDMPKLGDWVRAHLDGNMGDHGQPIGPEGLAALDHLLAHGFQLRLPLASSLESDDRHVMVATTEQCELLRSLEEHRRAAIAGVAGSGKTVLAVHKATELAEANASARVLLTCFNVPLGEHLKRLTAGHRNIVAGSFHQICAAVATEAGVEIPNTKDAKELFGEAYPTALVSAVCERPELAFDAVIVDEAQDFSDLWLASLEQTIASADSSFWVFYDDNQRLYERRGALEKRFPGPPFRLKRNVRNPKPVFERLFPLLGSTVATSAGPEGRPVEEIVVPDDRQMPAVLTRLVTQLVEKDQVEPAEIAVLGATSERLAELCPNSRFGRVQTCDAEQPVRGRVCLDTIRRFKGLERSVIILVDPADIAGADELQYVGLSRPTGHLILFGTRMPKMETYDE